MQKDKRHDLEKHFLKHFPRLLINQGGYVLENKNKNRSKTNYFFLERESGLSYIKLNARTNEVTYSENVIVNNEKCDY